MDEKDPMQLELWFCFEAAFDYDDCENVYREHEYAVCNPMKRSSILFFSFEEAKQEVICRTRVMFEQHSRHCYTMNTVFFRGDPEWHDLSYDEVRSIAERLPRFADLLANWNEDNPYPAYEAIVSRMEEILLNRDDPEDPDKGTLIELMAEAFHSRYFSIVKMDSSQISPRAREELYRLRAMKKDLETQIAALEERKRMMEVLY